MGNREHAWFAIEGSPPRIRGVLGKNDRSEATGELLLGALIVALRAIGSTPFSVAALARDDQALVLVGQIRVVERALTAIALVSAGCKFIGDDGFLIRERFLAMWSAPLWSFSAERRFTRLVRCG